MTIAPVSHTKTEKASPENNKLRFEDLAAHDWYRFVLSFPPHLVRTYIERFGLTSRKTVLDPFCGTGTTLVECKKCGIPSIGLERNPMVYFASQVKVDWQVNPDALMNHARSIAKLATKRLENKGFSDTHDLPLFDDGRRVTTKLLTLPLEAQSLLLRDSISPIPLHKVLVLLDVLRKHSDERFIRHERLALAKAMVFEISNLHFGPEVGLGAIKSDAPVVAAWLSGVQTIASDLRVLRSKSAPSTEVHLADSREPMAVLRPRSIDAVITSPPYPNEKDYTRTTRLESVLLGLIRDKDGLRAVKRALVRSNTRSVYKEDSDDHFVARNAAIHQVADAIEKRRIELGKTSGFERMYHRVAKLYFGGMARHLAALRPALRPGAKLAYVVGDQASYLRVMIRTGKLLAEIAESLGYEVMGIDLFRTRLATATKEQLREEVVLLRWRGDSASGDGR